MCGKESAVKLCSLYDLMFFWMLFIFYLYLPSMLTEWEVIAERLETSMPCLQSGGQEIQLGKEVLISKAALIADCLIFSK